MRFEMSCTMAAASSPAAAGAFDAMTDGRASTGAGGSGAGGVTVGGETVGGATAGGAVLGAALCLGISTSTRSSRTAGVVFARAGDALPNCFLLAWYLRHTQ